MLYSTYSGISIRQNNLNCVVIRRSKTGWKIDDAFTFLWEEKQDWKSAWAKLKKRLPRWRNCVSISLNFEEVLSKSSVINASLSEDETLMHVQEQLSSAITKEELVHDYRKGEVINGEQKLELYICKKDALTRLLERCALSVDVVGWVLTDLHALSKELELPDENRMDGFIEITEGRMVVSLAQQSLPMVFDMTKQSPSELFQNLTHAFANLSADTDKESVTLLVYGAVDRIAELNKLFMHNPEINLVDASLTHTGKGLTSFATYYPALACAMGAYTWSRASQ
ncbi:hypothetical protein BCT94_10885 [Vibrio breoganii]|uniref:hypothetical protein n=1 Tax=Vibrio breoganii TaxID=553239 RepID=UPI000C81D9DA|nr:hypothetical protein [Vibrio breoganii]PMG06455.1 hypothetical protein BCV08_04890 [Vibrio breoganii]PMH18636.1 hypothetical protein BCU74_08550 [Vibrio breoganii]PMJ45777.1 hypothetical protein BCU21_12875 [Vibrio breoganii]PMK55971.1 hypothetical protein BCT97_12685 [Vibrio breoganii]PMK63030.1 hypothetical protein BCT98_00180 [Vibrio breoganii]